MNDTLDSRRSESGNEEQKNEACRGATFGGCRYRLNYDRYQNDVKKATDKENHPASSRSLTVLVITLVVAFLFLFVGLLIYRYYAGQLADSLSENSIPSTTSSVRHDNQAQFSSEQHLIAS